MQEITESLKQLRNMDTEYSIFGSDSHQYLLNDPISLAEINGLERKYRCEFPRDYIRFLTELGNGGAGPDYGLFPIGFQDHGYELTGW